MSRISSFALALILLLAMCIAEEDETLISSEKIVSNTSNYKTTTAETGTFTKDAQGSIALYYPKTVTVKYEGPTARYDDIYVKRGDEVKAGQVLMSLNIEADQVALQQAELNLTRAQEDMEAQCEDYIERLDEAQRGYEIETDPYAREIKKLKVEKLRLQYEKYLLQAEKNIADLTETLEEIRENSVTQYVYAPFDGVVESAEYFKLNEYVYSGANVAVIYDPDIYLFSYDNSEGKLRYNMQVKLEQGNNKERQTAVGRVVASGNCLPGMSSGTTALIAVEQFDGEIPKQIVRPMVYFSYVSMENVVLVNRQAVNLYGGKYYVYKLSEDGMVSKRYVNHVTGGSDQMTWIINGVLDGDVLILN